MPSIWKHFKLFSVMLAGIGAGVLTGFADPGDAAKSTAEKFAYIEHLTSEFRITSAGERAKSLTRGQKSILQSSWSRNGFTDGQTYVWGSGGRPQVIGGAFLVPSEKSAYYEFVSLSPQPLICKLKEEDVWTPPAVDLSWQAISTAPNPAETPQARLTQLRSISRQIAGVARMGPPRYAEGSRWELRLLTTPIYRYADETERVLDGAVFVMSMGNDPQLLMLLEAQQEQGKSAWRVAFARLSGFELVASMGDEEIWNSSKVENGHDKNSVWHLSKPIDAAELFKATSE